MPHDLPPDVHDTLDQLLDASIDALPDDESTARAALDTVSRIVANKLPAGDRKDRLAHGCRAVEDLLDDDDPAVAVEYLRAMRTHLS